MRKKSHIALAKGILNGLSLGETIHHRFTLYVGSIWPDCTPSFLTRRHCIKDTMDIFVEEMKKFVEKYNDEKGMSIMMTFRMGKILHYVADYFTLPHNMHFEGNIKDHCAYEEKLKYAMYSFVDGISSGNIAFNVEVLGKLEGIKKYLLGKHAEYKSLMLSDDTERTQADCEYAYRLCSCVCASLLTIAANNHKERALFSAA